MRWFWLYYFCLIHRTAWIWITNYAHINRRFMFIFKGPNSQKATGAWKRCFVNDLLTSRLNALLLAAQNKCRESRDTAPGVRPSAREAVLETSSNWTIVKFFSKSLGLSVCPCYGKNAGRMFWKLLNIVLKSHSCVRDAGADGSRWWILLRPATNKWTYGKHWRLSVGVSTGLEHTSRSKCVGRGEIFQ